VIGKVRKLRHWRDGGRDWYQVVYLTTVVTYCGVSSLPEEARRLLARRSKPVSYNGRTVIEYS